MGEAAECGAADDRPGFKRLAWPRLHRLEHSHLQTLATKVFPLVTPQSLRPKTRIAQGTSADAINVRRSENRVARGRTVAHVVHGPSQVYNTSQEFCCI